MVKINVLKSVELKSFLSLKTVARICDIEPRRVAVHKRPWFHIKSEKLE